MCDKHPVAWSYSVRSITQPVHVHIVLPHRHTQTVCQHSAIPRSAHTVYLCVLCGSQNKQRLFPYTTLNDGFFSSQGSDLFTRVLDRNQRWGVSRQNVKKRFSAGPVTSTGQSGSVLPTLRDMLLEN